MGFIVKNTTIVGLIDVVCPHTCRGCGRLGEILCDCCKKDMELGKNNFCPICHRLVRRGKCEDCEVPLDGVYVCGFRDQLVGELVEEYKYNSARALAGELAGLMEAVLPEIDGEVIVVPLPTINKHIRERGFDHTWLLARKLAKMKGWRVEKMLERAKDTVQVGASMKKRRKQAKQAYKRVGEIRSGATYVLVDDVWTTGASMLAAERILRGAGAEKIIGVVLAVSR